MSKHARRGWIICGVVTGVVVLSTIVGVVLLIVLLPPDEQLPPASSLVPFRAAAAGTSNFRVGSAYNDLRLKLADSAQERARYDAFFERHFEMITPENACKAATIWPVRNGPFNFAPCEALLDWAEARNMTVRFHVLAWGSDALPEHVRAIGDRALPDWMTEVPEAERKEVLTEYITTVLRRLGGRESITDWDLINEAVCDDIILAGVLSPEQDNCGDGVDGLLKASNWVPSVPGAPEPADHYVDYVFNLANDLLPASRGRLVYNDYLGESSRTVEDPHKARRVFDMVKQARSRGVPVEAVGLQCHVSIFHAGVGGLGSVLFKNWLAGLREVLQWYADIGVETAITELDVGNCFAPLDCPSSEIDEGHREDLRALVYGEVVRACLEQPMCTSVQTWGFTDRFSWRAAPPGSDEKLDQQAHLFDANYEPKLAAFAFSEALAKGRRRD